MGAKRKYILMKEKEKERNPKKERIGFAKGFGKKKKATSEKKNGENQTHDTSQVLDNQNKNKAAFKKIALYMIVGSSLVLAALYYYITIKNSKPVSHQKRNPQSTFENIGNSKPSQERIQKQTVIDYPAAKAKLEKPSSSNTTSRIDNSDEVKSFERISADSNRSNRNDSTKQDKQESTAKSAQQQKIEYAAAENADRGKEQKQEEPRQQPSKNEATATVKNEKPKEAEKTKELKDYCIAKRTDEYLYFVNRDGELVPCYDLSNWDGNGIKVKKGERIEGKLVKVGGKNYLKLNKYYLPVKRKEFKCEVAKR